MDRTRLIIALVIVGAMVVASMGMLIVSVVNGYDYQNNSRIFEDISDLDFLDEYATEESITDGRVDAQSVYKSKAVRINYNGNEIDIFAYTFIDTASAIKYANKVSGNNYDLNYDGGEISRYYYKHTSFLNIFQSEELLVFSNENAYVIKSKIPEKEFNEFIEYFMTNLPLAVEITY